MADKDAERFETKFYDTVAVLVPTNMVPPNRWPMDAPSANTSADDLADRL